MWTWLKQDSYQFLYTESGGHAKHGTNINIIPFSINQQRLENPNSSHFKNRHTYFRLHTQKFHSLSQVWSFVYVDMVAAKFMPISYRFQYINRRTRHAKNYKFPFPHDYYKSSSCCSCKPNFFPCQKTHHLIHTHNLTRSHRYDHLCVCLDMVTAGFIPISYQFQLKEKCRDMPNMIQTVP